MATQITKSDEPSNAPSIPMHRTYITTEAMIDYRIPHSTNRCNSDVLVELLAYRIIITG